MSKINPYDIRTYQSFQDIKNRFLANILKESFTKNYEDLCWIWQGSKTGNNYGKIGWAGKYYSAHRLSYIIFKGLINHNDIVRHICDNKLCVNPKHLILGTVRDNSIDCLCRAKNGKQKLTPEEVIQIKKDLQKPYKGINNDLAIKYNISSVTISQIRTNRSWKWLEV